MKFLVPNYTCLQNLWVGGYRPQIPVLSILCPQLNLLTPPRKKFLGTSLSKGTEDSDGKKKWKQSHGRDSKRAPPDHINLDYATLLQIVNGRLDLALTLKKLYIIV